jgi:hypothetical protein
MIVTTATAETVAIASDLWGTVSEKRCQLVSRMKFMAAPANCDAVRSGGLTMFPMKSIRIASVCLLMSVVSNHAYAQLRQPLSTDAGQVTSEDVTWTLIDRSANVDLCSCDSSTMDCGSGVGCGAGVAPTGCLTRPRLLGDALGSKSWLAEQGVVTDFYLGQYYQGVTTGGDLPPVKSTRVCEGIHAVYHGKNESGP